jgi:hypothetical protein
MRYLQDWKNEINCFIVEQTKQLVQSDTDKNILEVGPEGPNSDLIKKLLPSVKTLGYNPKTQTSGYVYPGSNTTYDINVCDTLTLQEQLLINCFDVIYCLEVLEHVAFPFRAADNLTSMLKANGLLFISVPSFLDWHPHGYGYYEDYWRFLPGHIKHLFPNLKEIYSKQFKMDNVIIGMTYILRKE